MTELQSIPHIPYFQTTRYRVQTMVELAALKPGDKAADLGSGDGRIVIAFAEHGIETHGFETDLLLVHTSNDLIRQNKLGDKAIIHPESFWQTDLSQFDVVTIYGMPDVMELLEEKFHHELKPGARILSNYYQFPHWKFIQDKNHIFLYRI